MHIQEILLSGVAVAAIRFVPLLSDLFNGIFSPIHPWTQNQWSQLVEQAKDEYTLYSYGGLAAVVLFYVLCIPTTIVDLTGWPNWAVQYRTSSSKQVPVDRRLWLKTFLLGLLNNLVLGAMFLAPALKAMHAWALYGPTAYDAPLPPPSHILFEIAVQYTVMDFAFWALHICFHRVPFLFEIHKQHHAWRHPTAIDAVYCHPIELWCVNMPAAFAGLVFFGFHPFTFSVFQLILFADVVLNHCGYHFPFLPSAEHHDFHHLTYNSCFGGFGLADWVFGTDASFQKSVQFQRDVILKGTTPLTEKFPDAFSPKLSPASPKRAD